MQQLKKYGAIGGAISLALCWPLAVGQIGQNVIEDGITHLNSSSMTAELVSYDRGYLSSDVQTRYVVTDPQLIEQLALDGLPSEFIVNSHVSHGLLSLSAHSVLQDMDELPVTLDTVTQLNGNTDFTLALDTWHQATEGSDGAMVSVTPSTLKGHATVLGEINYDLNIPSVEVDFNSGEKLLISNVKGNGQGRKQNGFWLGEQAIVIGDMSVEDANQTDLFAMKNAKYDFASSIEESSQRVSSQHKVGVEDLVTAEGVIDKLSLDLELGDLDSNAFEKLIELYQSNPMLTAEDIQTAIPYVETLFSKGFYLSMNKMALTLGEKGEFESQWKITVPQGTDNVGQNPAIILPSLTGNLDTFISNDLVEQYPFIKQGVDEAIVMEFVKQTDAGYEIQAELKDGNLIFSSGQEIPLMALLMPAMMQP
ncbi:hypothetical protein VISI1226_21965 [Vibrio sinaloensis DSM 21326]|uniref:DUF945 domain-containing protein n=1 Tax=Vibrio sinaloensis DSM 21326 TaxID=945550 RepID=E8M6G3_PHOS4|nr:DUF945 family protein [Vibrio sinaloensis]EGA70281.1 hypothetical protein VISI1226_21965 [Vibrio sinaloensis DSM 21326]